MELRSKLEFKESMASTKKAQDRQKQRPEMLWCCDSNLESVERRQTISFLSPSATRHQVRVANELYTHTKRCTYIYSADINIQFTLRNGRLSKERSVNPKIKVVTVDFGYYPLPTDAQNSSTQKSLSFVYLLLVNSSDAIFGHIKKGGLFTASSKRSFDASQ